jgi:hypothetical protein
LSASSAEAGPRWRPAASSAGWSCIGGSDM